MPILYAGGGRGKRPPRLRSLRGGVRGNRPGSSTLRRAENPHHRRRAAGAPWDSGHLPHPAGHSGVGGAVPHHQRQPAAGIGKAPAGSRSLFAENTFLSEGRVLSFSPMMYTLVPPPPDEEPE